MSVSTIAYLIIFHRISIQTLTKFELQDFNFFDFFFLLMTKSEIFASLPPTSSSIYLSLFWVLAANKVSKTTILILDLKNLLEMLWLIKDTYSDRAHSDDH